jgi:hypothetical protein
MAKQTYMRQADSAKAAENGIKQIMARLKKGYMVEGGYMNKEHMDADHKILTAYLNRKS